MRKPTIHKVKRDCGCAWCFSVKYVETRTRIRAQLRAESEATDAYLRRTLTTWRKETPRHPADHYPEAARGGLLPEPGKGYLDEMGAAHGVRELDFEREFFGLRLGRWNATEDSHYVESVKRLRRRS